MQKPESACNGTEEDSVDGIRNVWSWNLLTQFDQINRLLAKFNVAALDTEFPGFFEKRSKELNKDCSEFQAVRQNVEQTKLIQVGLTLSDEEGNRPEPVSTWQFNLSFDSSTEKISEETKKLLIGAGIDFNRFSTQGISHQKFREALGSSRLLRSEEATWVVFHGAYDLAYLVRLLSGTSLPTVLSDFYMILKEYFPKIFDIKQLISTKENIKSHGLARLAQHLGCPRTGSAHQAGSDSLLTMNCFFKLLPQLTLSRTDCNQVFGLGTQLRDFSVKQPSKQGFLEGSSYIQSAEQYERYAAYYQSYSALQELNYQVFYYDPSVSNTAGLAQYYYPAYQIPFSPTGHSPGYFYGGASWCYQSSMQ